MMRFKVGGEEGGGGRGGIVAVQEAVVEGSGEVDDLHFDPWGGGGFWVWVYGLEKRKKWVRERVRERGIKWGLSIEKRWWWTVLERESEKKKRKKGC